MPPSVFRPVVNKSISHRQAFSRIFMLTKTCEINIINVPNPFELFTVSFLLFFKVDKYLKIDNKVEKKRQKDYLILFVFETFLFVVFGRR